MHPLRATGYARRPNRAPASTRFNILPPKIYSGLGPVQLPCALNHYCIWDGNCLRSLRRLLNRGFSSVPADRMVLALRTSVPFAASRSESAVAVKGPHCAVESLRGLLAPGVGRARRFTCEPVHPTSPGVFATLRHLEGAGSRFRLHVGRSARERGQARHEARVDPTSAQFQIRKLSMIRTKESPICSRFSI